MVHASSEALSLKGRPPNLCVFPHFFDREVLPDFSEETLGTILFQAARFYPTFSTFRSF